MNLGGNEMLTIWSKIGRLFNGIPPKDNCCLNYVSREELDMFGGLCKACPRRKLPGWIKK